MKLIVAARNSPLSKVQCNEVYSELSQHHPYVEFTPIFLSTTGDKDLKTSLRTLDKTDFFTKEIDSMLLSGQCRLGIHSAKDLPYPIPKGLAIAAITKGVDSSDSLVMRHGETLATLPPQSIIATSSVRREDTVRSLRSDLRFVDLRGTIGQRLEKLANGEADGVVIAEAALIRLNLTHLNRMKLPGETTPLQGQLAVVVREDDAEMIELFACLMKTVLYLGLELPKMPLQGKIIYYPVIQTKPVPKDHPDIVHSFGMLHEYTHVIFTSKTAVRFFFDYLPLFGYPHDVLTEKIVISVGQSTTQEISKHGIKQTLTAQRETSEGVIEMLEEFDLKGACVFWPHSALSRDVIPTYFKGKGIRFSECVFYETKTLKSLPLPDMDKVDEIYFTSPSTVDAFLEIFGPIPLDKVITAIGPVTDRRLSFQPRKGLT